ncbi:MAG: cytochrome c peroxidase [Chitinophagales bacterium]|nr:cytochrome c peroxidase [Chitinophagales bacterium]
MKVRHIFILILSAATIGILVQWSAGEKAFVPLKGKALLAAKQKLGRQMFFDMSMSDPIGISCASCHHPSQGFADPTMAVVSEGAVSGMFGTRNSPTVAYSAFVPPLHWDEKEELYIGGLFWDGHANTLAEQAAMPMMASNEMNNKDKARVVGVVKKASYSNLMLEIYGPNAFDNVDSAFSHITECISAYERSPEVNPFSSKYDHYLKGKAKLTAQEKRGLELFVDVKKGNCAACHPTEPDPATGKVLFTDFSYDNIGTPVNKELLKKTPTYQKDLGLGAFVKKDSENGKFRVPTLRNVAVTPPYLHNGIFNTLEEVVRFYNERDHGKFGEPEVAENVNQEELGDLKLTEQEVQDIVAFMKTLTDGYQP